ncbi:unnamed protein product [Calicophoron daubneyi]|uniref:Lipoma HMGIC fusion partner n=1 Tax=Calicophoron daubneyi TaxID=300641 RepID=A0AAV2TMY8_CALDB
MRCLWLIWTLLTWLAAILCTVGCLLPYWLKGYVRIVIPSASTTKTPDSETFPVDILSDTFVRNTDANKRISVPTDLGLFRRCGYPVYTHEASTLTDQTTPKTSAEKQPISWEEGCGHYSHITNVPHVAWHLAFFTLISACALLFFATFFLLMLGCALYLITLRIVYRSCQILLIISGLLTLLACTLYPIGWSRNTEIAQACGEESGSFQLGRCQIGWAYVLTCSGGLLSLFAATLPIIFPSPIRHINNDDKQRSLGPSTRSSNRLMRCLCVKNNIKHAESAAIDNNAFISVRIPSPANSAGAFATDRLIQFQRPGSVLLFPTPVHSGISPSGSSSPCTSVLLDRGGAAQPGTGSETTDGGAQRSSNHSSSLSNLVRNQRQLVVPTMSQYPVFCTYVPQRYSTGALLSQYHHPMGTMHPPSIGHRVSAGINPDPLIYVSEEEELEMEQISGVHKPSPNTQPVDAGPENQDDF